MSNEWPLVTNNGHLEVQRYLMCKSVSSFVIAVSRLQKGYGSTLIWFGVFFENVASSWNDLAKNTSASPDLCNAGALVDASPSYHCPILRFYQLAIFVAEFVNPWPTVTSGLGFDHLRHKLHSQLRHRVDPQMISG